ncbi:MAG: glutaredoxin [Treponema sp.]|nr:glutaredoxin [Treponema sp.]
MQIFGTSKCKNTQKALRFFKERNVPFQFRDLTVKPPAPGELDDMKARLGEADRPAGYAAFLDLQGAAAQNRGLAYRDYDPREELLAYPDLFKTPLVRPAKGAGGSGPKVVIGLNEPAWKELL